MTDQAQTNAPTNLPMMEITDEELDQAGGGVTVGQIAAAAEWLYHKLLSQL